MDTHTPLSLYLHIPFCSVKCTYCAFNTYIDLDHMIPPYMTALGHEIRFLGEINPHPSVGTIFFGGGTPSLIGPDDYKRLFDILVQSFSIDKSAEISIESNPNDLTLAYLRSLRDIGFNRLSIGMQSASNHILTLFNRRHDVDMVYRAVDMARQAGFDNINLDVIFGSPYETLNDWKKTLKMVFELQPEHLSMYGLELKGGTPLRQQVDAGTLPAPNDDLFADMYEYASEALSNANYEQYEISNWCKAQHQCRHNLQYWRNLSYAGLGAGAHGFAGGYRYSTITFPQRYIDALSDNSNQRIFPLTPAVAKETFVDRQTDMAETLMMGLRMTQEGIHRLTFQERFSADMVELFREPIDRFTNLGLLQVTDDRVKLTDRGRLLSNAVIREFI